MAAHAVISVWHVSSPFLCGSEYTMASLARTQVNMQSAMVYWPPQRKGPPHSSSFLSRVSRAELRGTCWVTN